MNRWKPHLTLLAVAVLCVTSLASQDVSSTPKDANQETTYLINWRPLEGEELRFYLEVKDAISHARIR